MPEVPPSALRGSLGTKPSVPVSDEGATRPRVVVDSLRLNLVGHGVSRGRRVAETVAAHLAESLNGTTAGSIALLELRVELEEGASEEKTAAAVAAAIRRAVERGKGRVG